MKQPDTLKWLRVAMAAAGLAASFGAQSALFPDDEARNAILELRQRHEAQKLVTDALDRRLIEENNQLRRGLLDLQNQIETLRAEQARMTGQYEQFVRELAQSSREIAEVQRRQVGLGQSLEQRLRVLEPQKVTVDGKEIFATPTEARDFDAALAVFRAGDFAGAQAAFLDFSSLYPKSGYRPSALFWLGNARYATRDYKEAIANFRSMLALAPEHPRAPEALLSIANCLVELKDTRAARRTLEEVVTLHPQSEAALAARDRLARLR